MMAFLRSQQAQAQAADGMADQEPAENEPNRFIIWAGNYNQQAFTICNAWTLPRKDPTLLMNDNLLLLINIDDDI